MDRDFDSPVSQVRQICRGVDVLQNGCGYERRKVCSSGLSLRSAGMREGL